jgi:DNA-directed RNA polymerase subunit RPC12/RpoP
MTSLHHTCDNCDSEFTIKYNEESCDDDPIFCPFCSEYILLEGDSSDAEDD